MMRRSVKPLVAIDIAVPSDIELEVGNIRNVSLYNMDDLQGIVERISVSEKAKRKERKLSLRKKSAPLKRDLLISAPGLSWFPCQTKQRKSGRGK